MTSKKSATGENPKRTHGMGIWHSARVPFTIRVDEKLKTAYTEATQALFGSTCLPTECIMAAIVGVYQNTLKENLRGVNPSRTQKSNINIEIGEIKIERNLRERRKLAADDCINETCEIGECREKAVDYLEHLPSGKVYQVCPKHAHLVEYPNNWRLVKGDD